MKSKEKIIKAYAEKALSDAEMQCVSGGGDVPSATYEGVTRMKCNFCGLSPEWSGDYMGQTLDCPSCGRHEFHGNYWVHYI